MKIYCTGSEHYINQISRIRDGFREIKDCEVVDNYKSAQVIYVNDIASFNADYRKNNPGAIIIYTVLDLAPHLVNPNKYDVSRYEKVNHNWKRDLDIEGITNRLKTECDIVCTICQDVSRQVKDWCGLDSHCIYNPIKPVSYLNLPEYNKVRNFQGKPYKYLFVGRARDQNKNFLRIIGTLQMMGEGPSDIAVVGTEDFGWGSYLGQLSDSDLNIMYNSCEYLFLPASYKSIGLPLLEAIVCKQKFLVSSSDPCTQEFVGDLGVPSDIRGIVDYIRSDEWNNRVKNFVNDHSEEYKQKFSPEQICKNILALL